MNLNPKKNFKKYFNISEILTADQIYKTLSLQDSEKLLKVLNRILNHQNRVKRRGKKTFIVDATPISKYKIVPFIFPKDNFKRTKLNDQLSYPLQVFKKTKKILIQKQFYKNLKHELLKKLDNWQKFKPIRGKIEDFFKLLKQGLNLRAIHKYTPKSVAKTVYLNVFLEALIISQGFYSKTAIQQLSEN